MHLSFVNFYTRLLGHSSHSLKVAPMCWVYAGGMASLICFLVIHEMPIASRAAATDELPPPLTDTKFTHSSVCP